MKLFSSERQMLRAMGFFSDQEGIISRYLAEKEGWDLHLRNSREFILDFVAQSNCKTVAILGSGWLLDLPLEEMSRQLDRILLLDIRHPAQVREKVARYPGVELLETDLSGGAIAFAWQAVKKSSFQPEKMVLRVPALPFEPDCLISLNILNQLDIIPGDYLQKHLGLSDEDLIPFRRRIQDFHVAWITQRSGCLVSDIVEYSSVEGKEENRRSLLFTGLPEGMQEKEWEWPFDSRGRYRENMYTRMQVKAIRW
ncbi:MAG: hypothetical protein ACOYXB_06000 [Bacteroidota bacterium]